MRKARARASTLDAAMAAAALAAEMDAQRLRSALQAIAVHANQMAAGAMTNRPHTNAAGFAYLAGLATDAIERVE